MGFGLLIKHFLKSFMKLGKRTELSTANSRRYWQPGYPWMMLLT